MKICAICPTYGRPALVANCLEMFRRQDHPRDECFLLIYDDLGQLSGDGPNWKIVSTTKRVPALYTKYTEMYRMLPDLWPQFEAVAIMEDDDLYGPRWLSSHAQALQTFAWSKPSQILCMYNRDILGGQEAFLETPQSCLGRFFASTAVRREALDTVGGFPDLRIHGADLHFIAMWQRMFGPPGDPYRIAGAQYLYGWGRAEHVSAGVFADALYNAYRPTDATPHVDLVPKMDEVTRICYRRHWRKESVWERRRRQGRCGTCDASPRCLETFPAEPERFWTTWHCPRERWQPDPGIWSDEQILAWMQRDPTAGRTPLPPIRKRNLLFHLYPARRNDLWKWHAAKIRKAAAAFNGQRVVAIACDDSTVDFDEARRMLGEDVTAFAAENDPRLREVATFPALLDLVASDDPHEATFYGHSKGNVTAGCPVGAELWTRTLYARLLHDVSRMETVLNHWKACGCTIIHWGKDLQVPYPSGLRHGTWMFSGTYYWFRHDAVFTNPLWRDVPSDTYGAEAWPSGLLDVNDVWSDYQACDWHVYPTPDPYSPYNFIDEVLE